ncbi:hypothetical protein HDV05_007575 [Chytridiales sp. JEL 0842]|nr:hypothetical protein HDV05_007575 [Chytridiales sp. JEL 0842]
MVQCLSSFKNLYLLVASGNVLYQLKIDSDSRKLIKGTEREMNWPITFINAFGDYLFIGTQRDSLSIFKYLPRKEFVFLMSDEKVRVAGDCIPISPSLAITSDRSGNIVALTSDSLSASNGLPGTNSLNTAFEWNMHEVALKLQLGSMNSDYDERIGGHQLNTGWTKTQDEDVDMDIGEDATESFRRGKRVDAVYACTVPGSLFVFYNIGNDAFLKLKSLEGILRETLEARPALGNDLCAYRGSNKAGTVVDGEMLLSFTRLSKEEQSNIASLWNMEWNETDPLMYITSCLDRISRM